MTDIALHFDNATGFADLLLIDSDVATDDGLRTAILISLFTDARAADDDILPAPGDRRGWWGDFDAAAAAGDHTGSKLWLLDRSKDVRDTLVRAREYAAAALAWLVDDGIAASVEVEVEVEAMRPGILAIGVTVTRPTGPGRQRFDYVWDATS